MLIKIPRDMVELKKDCSGKEACKGMQSSLSLCLYLSLNVNWGSLTSLISWFKELFITVKSLMAFNGLNFLHENYLLKTFIM